MSRPAHADRVHPVTKESGNVTVTRSNRRRARRTLPLALAATLALTLAVPAPEAAAFGSSSSLNTPIGQTMGNLNTISQNQMNLTTSANQAQTAIGLSNDLSNQERVRMEQQIRQEQQRAQAELQRQQQEEQRRLDELRREQERLQWEERDRQRAQANAALQVPVEDGSGVTPTDAEVAELQQQQQQEAAARQEILPEDAELTWECVDAEGNPLPAEDPICQALAAGTPPGGDASDGAAGAPGTAAPTEGQPGPEAAAPTEGQPDPETALQAEAAAVPVGQPVVAVPTQGTGMLALHLSQTLYGTNPSQQELTALGQRLNGAPTGMARWRAWNELAAEGVGSSLYRESGLTPEQIAADIIAALQLPASEQPKVLAALQEGTSPAEVVRGYAAPQYATAAVTPPVSFIPVVHPICVERGPDACGIPTG